MPKVSVIVPNYNHALYLEQRIESVLNQTYQDFELILLDDCSTDNSITILEKYANHPKVSHFEVNKQNSGSTFKQWDKGISCATGEWIWIAESDDWAETKFLETIIAQVDREKNIALCFSHTCIADADGNKIGLYDNEFEFYNRNSVTSGNALINKYLHSRNIFPNASAVLFRKEHYRNVNLDELVTYKINGDWYLWINLLLNGDCCFVSDVLNNFRRHDGAGSPKNVLNFKNVEEAIRINLFLKQKKLKYKDKYWLRFWFEQANYNVRRILTHNFVTITKNATLLLPYALLYLLFIFMQKKCHRKI